MRNHWFIPVFVAFSTFASAAALGQVGTWRVTTPSLEAERVAIDGIEVREDALRVNVDGEMREAALIEHLLPAGYGRAGAPTMLYLLNGDVLRASVDAIDDVTITVTTLDFGQLVIPLDQAIALAATDAVAERLWWNDRPGDDRLVLANGDAVAGFVAGFDEETGRFSVDLNSGGSVDVAIGSLRLLRFADAGPAAVAIATGSARIALTDGSVVSAGAITVDDSAIELTYREKRSRVPLSAVSAIEPTTPRVFWLADATPTTIEHEPYFDADSPPKIAWGLTGMLIGDGLPPRSLLVRSKTTVTYAIPEGGWSRLRGRVQIDLRSGPLPYANVDVRILLDDRIAFERDALTAADEPVAFDIDLAEASAITLLVDYGAGLDAQDIVLWNRPALTK